jgi:hypothetical protein
MHKVIAIGFVILSWCSFATAQFAIFQVNGTGVDPGWIVFTPSIGSGSCTPAGSGTYTGTCIIYVSKSGNDSNTCIAVPPVNNSFATPCLTVSHGLSLIRAGKPDWVLFKKGDVWSGEQFQNPVNPSGRSASEPILISSYGPGTTRPQFKSGASSAVSFSGGGAMNFWAWDGLDLYASTRDPNSPDFTGPTGDIGFFWLVDCDGLVMQNMLIRYYTTNASIGGVGFAKLTNMRINRNVIVDSYNESGHSEGLIMDNHFNTSITENLFDHNGWNENTTLFNAGADATVFNQNVYVQVIETAPDNPAQTSTPTTFSGNISANASAAGLQLRTGGTVFDNLFVHNPIAFDVRMNGSTVTNNVVTEGYNIQQNAGNGGPQGRGWGVVASHTIGTHTIQNNVFAHAISTDAGRNAISFDTATGSLTNANPTVATIVSDNIGQTNMQMLLKTAGGGLAAWSKYYAVSIVLAGGPGNGATGTLQLSTTPSGSGVASSAAFSSDLVPTPVTASSNVIFQWKTGTGMAGNVLDDGSDGNGNTMSPNDIDSSGPHIGTFPYPDSTRSVGSYAGTLGLTATLTGFLSAARLQSKDNWNPALMAHAANNYIRAGFGF